MKTEVEYPLPTVFINLISEEDAIIPDLPTDERLRVYATRLREIAKRLEEIASKSDTKTSVNLPELPVRMVLSAPPDTIKRFEKDPSKIIPVRYFEEDDGEE